MSSTCNYRKSNFLHPLQGSTSFNGTHMHCNVVTYMYQGYMVPYKHQHVIINLINYMSKKNEFFLFIVYKGSVTNDHIFTSIKFLRKICKLSIKIKTLYAIQTMVPTLFIELTDSIFYLSYKIKNKRCILPIQTITNSQVGINHPNRL